MGDDAPKDGLGLKFVQYLAFGGVAHRPVGVPDRVRLRRATVPPGVPADADRRRGRVRLGRRPDHDGPRRRHHRRAAGDRRCAAASRSWSDRCSARRSTGSRCISGRASWSNCSRLTPLLKRPDDLRCGQRPRGRAPSGCGSSRCGSTPSTTTRGRRACGRRRWRWPCPSRSSPVAAARWSAWC